jgi:hypothetical protein
MMSCGYQCHMIGGPYIAENPACPVHGEEARYRERQHDMKMASIHTILQQVWYREISAGDAMEMIEQLD